MLLMARIFQILGLLRAQVAILEQNAVPGFTNRVLAKFVTKVFMAFPNQEVSFQGKAYWTGNPTRANLKAAPYPELGNRLKIFVFGGSQGARSLNRLVLGLIPKLKSRFPNLHFDWIHQTGSQDYDMVSREHQALGTGARVEKFIDDMQSCYQSSHLVICRAGASTLSELAAVGRPSVLVPFPYASDQHQDHNAQIFAKNGGAMIYFERPSHEEDFQSLVVNLIAEPEKLVRMAEAARSFFKPRASEEIVERLFED
jgi:UDP-N-acetylglucosamine--N-acetylmuramyl-(pentapeptide) pyrophosphoryl-undecaprenol N-acetylglucosamine transferase